MGENKSAKSNAKGVLYDRGNVSDKCIAKSHTCSKLASGANAELTASDT